MDIQNYVATLEEHREDLELSKSGLYDLNKLLEICEALDYAIDSLKAVDESLNGGKNE